MKCSDVEVSDFNVLQISPESIQKWEYPKNLINLHSYESIEIVSMNESLSDPALIGHFHFSNKFQALRIHLDISIIII